MQEITVYVKFIATLIGMIAGVITYSFSTFATKEMVEKTHDQMDKRLERIENKLDQFILKNH
jgi:predicted DNA-binding transcriptional regulator